MNQLAGLIFLVGGASAMASPKSQTATPRNNCSFKIETREVRGFSLKGLIEYGNKVRIKTSVPECLLINRGEIVMFRHPGRAVEVIKQVRALGGDKISTPIDGKGFHFAVNGTPIKTPSGAPHFFMGKRAKMLQMYVKNYSGQVPVDTYFVFGTATSGSLDSASFGPIQRSSMLGIVVKEKK